MKVQPPLLWSCILALAVANAAIAAENSPRQIVGGPPQPSGSSQATPSASAPAPAPTPATPTNPPSNTDSTTPTPTQNTNTSAQPTNNTPSTSGAAPGTSSPNTDINTPPPPSASSTPPSAPPVISLSTAPDGDKVTLTITSSASSSAPAATSSTPSNEESDGGGLSTGSIIGMSVAAGVAAIGIIGFFVWKFTRKRFSDFDDNEAIKWPELNTHGGAESHALPARETGRSGFGDTASEADLSRVNSTSNYSTPDFGSGGPDPYAVPPLPHLNPNQPYRDDPNSTTGYYDPYRGPVPGTLEHGTGDWQPEAYPMAQFGGPQARASPAPDYMYEGGRQSPTVSGNMYGRNSPAPQASYGGRASPAPQVANGGRASPGPQAAYAAGRASPGPGTAYDAYGAR
ncbi:hypothetical protein AN958_05199 [Leucoagaricus sp. SymC.cos]|nr:hypothetical protein AN958_05199 [Leucoagaricus sp. SymC.cos]